MRIDASNVLGQGGVKIKSSAGATDSLKEGDIVRAGVVSNDKNGNVSLKMENGQSFSAKLGVDVKLSPGDTVLLEVTGKEKGQVTLSFSGIASPDDDLSLGQKNLVADFTDKSLVTYASKLSDLNMPVTEESARVMRELVTNNPKMSLDDAAFIASNKLAGSESLVSAALAALAGGDKTDAMIARLLALNNAPAGENAPVGKEIPAFTVNTANSAPLTDLLTTIVKSFSEAQTIITQTNINLQINAENTQENLSHPGINENNALTQQNASTSEQFVSTANTTQIAGSDLLQQNPQIRENLTEVLNNSNLSQEIINITNRDAPGSSGLTDAQGNPVLTNSTNELNNPGLQNANNPTGIPAEQSNTSQTQQTQLPSNVTDVVAKLLSDIPEFSGTPQSALHRFSEMLLRVAIGIGNAGLEAGESTNSTEALTAQLDKLFTKISRDDSNAGARLRDARDELFTRLALIEEAISRAAQPARAEMLLQTQKLMDHVRLLNSIEQFVYMQLPVQLSEEKKTAELYVFKRKGGKRADPDNVNILLAIDLEFMGHWEALVNIKNKDVSIQMEVPGEAEKEHFNANTVLLHNMLNEAGFKLVNTNIKFIEEETTPLTALSTLDRYNGGKQGIIDFKI